MTFRSRIDLHISRRRPEEFVVAICVLMGFLRGGAAMTLGGDKRILWQRSTVVSPSLQLTVKHRCTPCECSVFGYRRAYEAAGYGE